MAAMSIPKKVNCEFVNLAAARLRAAEPSLVLADHKRPNGDHALQVGLQGPYTAERPKPAVVLVPVVEREEPSVLFTVRADSLREHSGQVAFPGGRVDPTDTTLFDAALREADEEIGLPRNKVDLLGYLDVYLSGTNYLVVPVVAMVKPDFMIKLNPEEVSDVFEVPLSVLMDPVRHELHSREWKGELRHYYAISFEQRYIWGVTAGIVRNMYERLFRP